MRGDAEHRHIPFNRPYATGKEPGYIAEAQRSGSLGGDGDFSKRCHEFLERTTGSGMALLTHSCTAALEMAALLLECAPGDEVIMPSYTFVSTANAFVLRGATPVFVDIRPDTLNLAEDLIEAAITPRTKAIVPVHYAGVACEMDTINAIAARHGLRVVEDAAQGVMSTYKGRALGGIGHLGAYSFHETKNITSGEGGALIIGDAGLSQRAEILREKGTDRSRFARGEVDKYTWQDIGSSYIAGELTAAYLWAQLEAAAWITSERLKVWNRYHELIEPLERKGLLRRPVIPNACSHNAHMYYVMLAPGRSRAAVLSALVDAGIRATFHYVPLHASPGGRRHARSHGTLAQTELAGTQLIRLPLWIGLGADDQDFIAGRLGAAVACA
jgi:dTDP-4-amino-4,6-dideoxygalactose transaminase